MQVFLPPALMPASDLQAGADFSLNVEVMVDNSGSIEGAGLTTAVIDGHNGLLDQLTSPPQAAENFR